MADDARASPSSCGPRRAFADGSALTAEDVCDSFRLLSTEGHERIRITIRDVAGCEVLGPQELR